ncbi:TetR/AcrR family transcriptional regulator [Nocardia sp. NPDC050712]|uniref:TetR/AcrR family transcriptional regulator n=1 Tax=Nocardia sp. NPDC050712 TaxID=3155518 RepID=UPI0033CBE25D
MVTRTSYHHGALRDALIAACLRLIETEGIGAVSLRRVAREAGVSTAAPYHHFADRAALLAVLSANGFERLGADLAAARASADSPLAALTALAEAYVRFSREQPAYFRLMFRPELSEPDKHPAAMVAGEAAFGELAAAVADCVDAGLIEPERADTVSVAWWGIAHGLASLWLDGQLAKRAGMMNTTAPELVQNIIQACTGLVRGGAK